MYLYANKHSLEEGCSVPNMDENLNPSQIKITPLSGVSFLEGSNTPSCAKGTCLESILDALRNLKDVLGGDFDSHSKNIAYAKVSQESRSHGSSPPYPWCLHICKRLHFINSYEHKSPSN